MRLSSMLTALSALALAGAPLHAQHSGLSVGAAVPSGSLGTIASTGLNVAYHYEQPLGRGPISLRAEGGLAWMRLSDLGPGVSGNALLAPVTANGVVRVGKGPVRAYATAGGGVYFKSLSVSNDVAFAAWEGTSLGVNVGGGLEFGRFFVDARLHSARGDRYVPISFGYRF